MSPSRSAPTLTNRDIVMGPPPPPPVSIPAQQPPKENQDFVHEKYRKLKRRYFELEEKLKEAQYELKLSSERNAKLCEDREMILQRIHELESRSEPNVSGAPWPPSSAFPRSLLSSRARAIFVSNLRQAMAEDEAEDHSADPMLSSRHLAPHARKRTDDEFRDHTVAEEDLGDARRQTKRSRGAPKARDQSVPGGQSLVNLAPAPQPQPQQGTSDGDTPLLVSNKGQKLRLKPPVKPSHESDGARASSPLSPVLPDEVPGAPYSAGPFSANGNASHHHLQSGSSTNTPSAPGQSTALTPNSPASSVQPSEIQRHAKPKRLKAHTVTSKSFSIPTVPRDNKARPLLPLTVGIMTVHNLGEVCMREHFHTERYIFPVGYEVTRRYHSTVDPTAEAVYQCSILDGGDGPKFKIVGSDVPNCPIIAGTATGAWSNIVKQANAIRNRQHSNSVSGPDFFGLGQNTIKHLIQELPGADRLRDYVWQHFTEGGPLGGRHAAVIPALPEEHSDSALGPGLGTDGTPNNANHKSGEEEGGRVSHSSNDIRNNGNATSYSHQHHQHHHQQYQHHYSPLSPSRPMVLPLHHSSSSSSGAPAPDAFQAVCRALPARGRESPENGP